MSERHHSSVSLAVNPNFLGTVDQEQYFCLVAMCHSELIEREGIGEFCSFHLVTLANQFARRR